MVQRYEPKAVLLMALLVVVFPTLAVQDAAAEEQTDGDAAAPAVQDSAEEEVEFEANIKSLISERQRLKEAKARLTAVRLRIERTSKAKQSEKPAAPEPKPAPQVEPKQCTQRDEAETKAIEIPLNLENTKSLMSLASSLYELGHYGKALACYEQVNTSKLTDHDAMWLSFQKGNCYFFTREYEKCEKCMASITTDRSETIWSKHAAGVIKDIRFWEQREALTKAAEQSTQKATDG